MKRIPTIVSMDATPINFDSIGFPSITFLVSTSSSNTSRTRSIGERSGAHATSSYGTNGASSHSGTTTACPLEDPRHCPGNRPEALGFRAGASRRPRQAVVRRRQLLPEGRPDSPGVVRAQSHGPLHPRHRHEGRRRYLRAAWGHDAPRLRPELRRPVGAVHRRGHLRVSHLRRHAATRGHGGHGVGPAGRHDNGRGAGGGEEIDDGVTGVAVPWRRGGRAAAAQSCASSRTPQLRRRMGADARRVAYERFNAATNYQRIVELCKQSVGEVPRASRGRH